MPPEELDGGGVGGDRGERRHSSTASGFSYPATTLRSTASCVTRAGNQGGDANGIAPST